MQKRGPEGRASSVEIASEWSWCGLVQSLLLLVLSEGGTVCECKSNLYSLRKRISPSHGHQTALDMQPCGLETSPYICEVSLSQGLKPSLGWGRGVRGDAQRLPILTSLSKPSTGDQVHRFWCQKPYRTQQIGRQPVCCKKTVLTEVRQCYELVV